MYEKGEKVQMKDADLYLQAGIRIQKLRENYHLTRNEMSELVGISSKFIYEIELGKKGFSASVLYKIADAFGVNCDYIMTGKE